MKAYSLIFGYFCINAAIWLINIASILLMVREPITPPSDIGALFNISTFTVLTGIVGGAVTTILAIITRSYTFAAGVLVLWVVGILFNPIQDIFLGLPKLIVALTPSEIWFIVEPIVGFASFILFVFFVEIILGRDIST